jgi:NAD(P) transhydrogenase subunit beta
MISVETAATAAYIVAALLFILALAGLARHETSRVGNAFGITGMSVALAATIALAIDRDIEPLGLGLLIGAMSVGAAIGLWRARVVEMTGMPELIALLHSFVGLAAVLVGWNGYWHVERHLHGGEADILRADGLLGIHSAEVFIGVFIGAVTFTGSIVANLKLSARMKSKPLMLPGKNILNVGALVAFVVLTVWFTRSCGCSQRSPRWRCCWVGTWSPPSAAGTCRSWCRCSTATPAGPPPPPASCSATTCSSSPARWSDPRVPTCRTSCARR